MTEPKIPDKKKIDAGAISAWIGLASTIFGYCAGLAKSSQSLYSPIDTGFLFLSYLILLLFGVAWLSLMLAGLILGWFAETVLKTEPSEGTTVFVGLLIVGGLLAIFLPLVWEEASQAAQDPKTGVAVPRFLGVLIVATVGWLCYKYLYEKKKT